MSSSKGPSWRQVMVYVLAAALVAFADPRPVTFAIGCGVVLVAWLLRIWAFGHHEKNQLMVTTGPYAHVRNPAYLGSFIAMIGVALAAGNGETRHGRIVWGFALVLVVAFFVAYLPRKFQREYTRLERLFGEQVARHAANVPDFVPRLSAWRSGDDRRFSWQRVGANHEWPWGAVLAVLMLAIWFVDRWSPVYAAIHGR
jgi:protein-S-isoprenylcysteine O-methyltransferase Ste14